MTSLVALPYAALHAHDRATPGWCFDAAGALVQVGANLPRVDYDPGTLAAQGVLFEGAATNLSGNPRFEGAVAGIPGTQPTGNTWLNSGAGLTREIVGVGVEDGWPHIDVRWSGTPSSSTTRTHSFVTNTAVAALPGQSWTSRVPTRLVGGSVTNVSVSHAINGLDGGGTQLDTVSNVITGAVGVAALRSAVHDATVALTNPSTAFVRHRIIIGFTLGQAADITLRMAAPQLWQSAVPFSPTLPPVATLGPSTRAADRITRTLNHRFQRSAFTLLARGLFAQASPAGMTRGVLQIDDGTNANRIRVENTPGGSALQIVATIGGADVATLPLGNMTPGTPFSVAFAAQDGDLAAVRNGGTVQTAAVAVPPGLAFMRVGATGFDHANPMNGWYRAHRLLRGRVDNASLITLAA
jgi:hypothetical protein